MSRGKYKRKRDRTKRRAQQHAEQVRLLDSVVVPTKEQGESSETAKPKRSDKEESPMGLREMAKRSSLTDWCITAFTAVLSIVAFYQYVVMGGQLDVMRDDQRPWLGMNDKEISPIPPLKSNTPFAVWVTIANFGKSPAFLTDQATEIRPMEGEFPDTIEFSANRPTGYERQREPVFPGDPGIKQMVKKTLTDDEVKKITKGDLRLYLFGQLHYTNSTDSKIHTTRFCWYFASTDTTKVDGTIIQNVVLVGCHGRYSYAD